MDREKNRPTAGRRQATGNAQTHATDILPDTIVAACKDADGNDVVLTAHNPDESAEWVIVGLLRRGGRLEVDCYDL